MIGLELPLNHTAECPRCGEHARIFISCTDQGVVPTVKCQQCNTRAIARFTFQSLEWPRLATGVSAWLEPARRRTIEVVELPEFGNQ